MRATFISTRRRLTSVGDIHSRSPSPRFVALSHRSRPLKCRATFGGQEFPDMVHIPDSIPVTSTETDWRHFRAKLVTRYLPQDEANEWVHNLPGPELGCILVAHPMMFTQQQTYFYQAVIFIFLHGQTGSAGLILNKPIRYGLSECEVTDGLTTGFEENPLYLGGDVGDRALNMLHPFSDLEESVKVVDGVYLNGFREAQNDVLQGRKNPSDFKWYARYCGWNPGQLEEECKNGIWFPAACSANLIMKDQSLAQGPADMWHQVLQLMGGKYKTLSDVIIGSYVDQQ